MALVKAKDISFDQNPLEIRERTFQSLGDQKYAITYKPAGIVFEVDRLRRERHELQGELLVRVNGNFHSAKTIDGILSLAEFNLSGARSRKERAGLLAERSGAEHVDWYGLIEEFCVKVISAERIGSPAIILADEPAFDEDEEAWQVIKGFPLLQHLPMVVYADSGAGKSMLAMWIAGQLCRYIEDKGHTVMYADWELSKGEHRKRMGRLFQPMPRNLVYVRCDRPIRQEIDRIRRLSVLHKTVFMVCDSVGFALEGGAESSESATEYFRALRQLPIGSLNLAHTPKQRDDNQGREVQIFGSVFFKAGGRSIWHLERVKVGRGGELKVGLFHKKTNVGEFLKPIGVRFKFHPERTTVDHFDPSLEEELAAAMPILDRMSQFLRPGPQTVKDTAEALGVPQDTIRKAVIRHASKITRVGNRIALKSEYEDHEDKPQAAVEPELF